MRFAKRGIGILLAVLSMGCRHGKAAHGDGTGGEPSGFVPRRVSRVYRQTLQATPERILPLLTPVREAEWANGWAPTILHASPSPETPGTVFRTRHAGEPDTLWLLVAYEPARGQVRYVHVTPGSNVCEIDISLVPGGEGTTHADVRYTYTTLGAPGDVLVDHFTEEHYVRWMKEWEQELNHYLVTGQRLPVKA